MGNPTLGAAIILWTLIGACPAAPRPAPTLGSPSTAASQRGTVVDTTVTFIGVARDAKQGAMLILDNGTHYAVDGLDAWPAALHGKRVTVTGVLEQRSDLPVFERRPGEPERTGIPVPPGSDVEAARRHTVIANARLELAP